jgi:hypothetical protein
MRTTSNDTLQDSARRAKGSSSPDYDVAIIGAGPYGLSAAAYLKGKGLGVRVFGQPMDFWANQMPAGMLLRSPRAASNLADPRSALTLDAYESAVAAKPAARVPLETFVSYGRWFQRQCVPDLDTTLVSHVERDGPTFIVTTQKGSALRVRRIVIAAGIGPFQRRPDVFASLAPQQVSHCYEGRKVAEFAGKRVAIIGAGQSALEWAAILHEAGSNVEVIAARPALRWIGMHPRLHHLGPLSTMMYSKYDVGPAGISRLVAAPKLVSYIPLPLRDRIRTRAVRSAGSPWLIPRLAAVKVSVGRRVRKAVGVGDEVQLNLDDGSDRRVDHVLMGTGYEVDISRYGFLSADLTAQVRCLNGYPDLGAGFTSSVPGLHFIGGAAARSFGPLLYFVAGTKFASEELAAYIHRNRGISQ